MKQDTPQEIYGAEPNPIDYWRVLVKHKRLIKLAAGTAFVISIIVSLLLPKTYVSTASILPPQEENLLNSNRISKLPEAIGALAGGVMGIKSSADLWIGILKSRTAKDAIIVRFGLKEIYGAETMDDARKALGTRLNIDKSREEIISITVESNDPEMAAQIANAFVKELDKVNKSVVMTSGKRTRIFIEKRLDEAKVNLAKSEEAIKTFQEKNNAIKLDDQSTTIIEAIGEIQGLLMAREVELETLLSYATPSHPRVEILQAQLDGLGRKLKELEEGKKVNTNSNHKDIFIPTSKIPDLALRYVRLLRDAKVQQGLYEFLTRQYEMARIQEAKDSPTIQVLDVAKVPEKKFKPRRTFIVILSTLTVAFLAVFLSFFMEYIERTKGTSG